MDVLSDTDLETLRHGDIISFHLTPLPQLLKRFHTDDENGLTEERARKSLEFQGPNTLKKTRQKSKLLFFLKHFVGGFSLLLWFSAALCFIAYFIIKSKNMPGEHAGEHMYVGVVLVVVIIITGIFTYIQSKKSSRLMDSFQNMMPRFTKVIRDGNKMVIPVEEVVLGDLVELNAGDQVPADLRVVRCNGMKVDNSCLTGESHPHALSTEAFHENAMEAKNLAFSSTLVVEGSGRGIVIACGENTQMGRIASLASGLQATETPLAKEIRRFVKIITGVSIFLGALFFVLAIINQYTPLDAALFLIAIMVANIPEGLLVTVTMCLTLSANRMAKKNCLVKHLEAVEALGSTSVICSDKTGTLTQNKMTVSHLWYGGVEKKVDTSFPEKSVSKDDPLLAPLLRVAILCNRAEFKTSEGQTDEHAYQRKVLGDASESALLKFTAAVVGDVKRYRQNYPKIVEIPFNSVNKYQVSIHELDDPRYSYLLVMKGAPERIVDMCNRINTESGVEFMTREIRKDLRNTFTALAGYGERVLGFCELHLERREYPKGYKFDVRETNFPLRRLVFLGLISMIDPPRPGVRNAVAMCRTAGIKVIMVTGDHPNTALAIARQVGIVTEGTETPEEMANRMGIDVHHVDPEKAGAIVVHGSELLTLSPRELDEILMTFPEIVFARTTPTQKLNIVEGCQRLGAIVAVTGDGVNDSPALKKANIGVAMGIAGSDVAKQAADLVLLDDNFATIVLGIEEGRIIFDNLKKSIAYTLTSNTPEMLPFMFTLLYKVPLPLGVLAILCINVGTDIWPAISLAYEPAESDIMKREPRDPKHDKLVNWMLISMAYLQIGMIQAAAGFFMYFFIMAENGFLPNRLMGLLESWHSNDVDALEDSYGQEWSFEDRRRLEYLCHTGFFVAIVEVQWADVIICKTRNISIIDKKMTNYCLNAGIVFETAFAVFFVYTPYVNDALNMVPLEIHHWILPLPFVTFILLFDETRRYWIRKRPYSFVRKETYY